MVALHQVNITENIRIIFLINSKFFIIDLGKCFYIGNKAGQLKGLLGADSCDDRYAPMLQILTLPTPSYQVNFVKS